MAFVYPDNSSSTRVCMLWQKCTVSPRWSIPFFPIGVWLHPPGVDTKLRSPSEECKTKMEVFFFWNSIISFSSKQTHFDSRFRFKFTWGNLQTDCLADRPVLASQDKIHKLRHIKVCCCVARENHKSPEHWLAVANKTGKSSEISLNR